MRADRTRRGIGGGIGRRLAVATTLVVAGTIGAAGDALAQGAPRDEGEVRFYNVADSDFDVYIKNASPAEREWMRRRYARMQTYSPFFDDHVWWYSRGWVYKDAYAIKPEWDVFQDHPEWILRDAAGNLLYIPWACSGGTCPQYAADFGNPAFRVHWIAEAASLLNVGYAGFWIDDVNMTWRVGDGDGNFVTPVDPRTGTGMTLADWRRYMAEFMVEIREALPQAEIAHNVVWYAAPVGDPYQERQIGAADVINLERGVNDDGLKGGGGTWGIETFLAFVDHVHTHDRGVVLMDYGNELHEREYGLAGWFLVSAGRDFMCSNQLAWTAPGSFWPGYQLDLRRALGPRYAWQGLLRRDFAGGLVLLNEPEMPTTTVDLPGTFWTIEGAPVTSVTLGAKRAVVLLRGGG